MPVATPRTNVAVKIFTQNTVAASSSGARDRKDLVALIAMMRPNPMVSGTKMKW